MADMNNETKLITLDQMAHYHAKSKLDNDDRYVKQESGKGLSEENYTKLEKEYLAGLILSSGNPGGGGTPPIVEDEIVIINAETFNQETMTGTFSQETADILQNYSGEKPTYINCIGIYVPFNGGEDIYHTIGNTILRIQIDYATLTFSVSTNNIPLLDENGKIDSIHIPKLTLSQMPDLGFYDDVVEGYLNPEDNLFYKEYREDLAGMGVAVLYNYPITGESGKIYLDLHTNNTYRWSGSQYVRINPDEYTLATDADIDALFE